ncbi:Uncharacterised protein [Mycobacteroides abscessus subsp. abscessus]|nr:Uncharacterised protein [Mycobacteroides abscessus subsp. abscessus]
MRATSSAVGFRGLVVMQASSSAFAVSTATCSSRTPSDLRSAGNPTRRDNDATSSASRSATAWGEPPRTPTASASST